MWFRKNKEEFASEILKLKQEGKDKDYLTVYFSQKSKVDSNYRLVPVGSNWTESRFIIGYNNILTKEYVSTDSLDLI